MKSLTIDQWLYQHGLLLCAFRWNELPSSISDITHNTLPVQIAQTISDNTILVLLANAGPKFWRSLQLSQLKNNPEPIDDFSVLIANEFQSTYLGNEDFTQLYPTPAKRSHVPLMRLGGLAGWNIPSPLGLGLHPEYGPWSAYRVAWLTQSDQLPNDYFVKPSQFKHIGFNALQDAAELCVGCAAPCTTACPASAVQIGHNFNIDACHEHREPLTSECHVHCAARRACPIGKDHQYADEQLAHHMGMRWRTV